MMELPRERRKGLGRRLTDRASNGFDPIAVRGLLHDVGHQVVTLSYLVETVRTEADLPGGTRQCRGCSSSSQVSFLVLRQRRTAVGLI
jgi:hypothetical protein